jgi:fatty acid desaturase
MWALILGTITSINGYRTLGAHRYRNDGESINRTNQLLDTIDTGGFLTELWAPVGFKYHALHHYFPAIPYHNLGIAHARLVNKLPCGANYLKTSSKNLGTSLRTLWHDATRFAHKKASV